ncbi:MAG: hypothetical protein GYA47_00900 [Desulfovibrio sp.]|nr:hypothetical protein [Desulfovibrio sp.]
MKNMKTMRTLQTSPPGDVCTRIAAHDADSQGRADFTDMHGWMAEDEAIQAVSAPAMQIAGVSKYIRHDMKSSSFLHIFHGAPQFLPTSCATTGILSKILHTNYFNTALCLQS